MKIIAFGVREPEKAIFIENKKDNYELQLESGNLNEDTMEITKGFDAVIARASDNINEKVVETLKGYGINYILTRTAGFNHMDTEALKKHNVLSARVPGYSPTAISEVALSTALALNRKVWQVADAVRHGDYVIKNEYFANEIRNSKVGVIGVGKIGLATAKLFKAIGATVYGFDKYQSKEAKKVVKFRELDDLLAECNIVVTHMAYIKGENDNFFDKSKFAKMKDGAIFVNAARGEVMNENDLYDALSSNKLSAASSDVLRGEKLFFNKKDGVVTPEQKKLIGLYPRFVLTTHIGSYTDSAVKDMVTISYNNLEELVKTGKSKNQI